MKLSEQLRQFLDPSQVLDDPSSLKEYGKDWTKHIEPHASAIVFPKSTADVKKITDWARSAKIALVPSGGRTGLSGAAIATKGEVVVSFQKMNRIVDFNPMDHTMTVEPGVVTEAAQNFAKEKGLYFPVDFASRGSSQIGGNVATNAGGIKVLRYGLIRPWVQALEVVTGAGQILKLNNSLVKNATGYDLRQLFIGSEGTLGFVTEITLGLTRPPESPQVFLFGVSELDAVMKIYHAFKSQLPLLAFEMFTELALKCVLDQHKDLTRPFAGAHAYYLLAEIEGGSEEAMGRALQIFEKGMEDGWIQDGVLSQSPQQAKDFWRLREDISEATSPYSPYKNDVSVRISLVPKFLVEMDEILKREYPDIEVVWFGHIGDGNLHINILKPAKMASEEFVARCKKVDEILFGMIQKFGGSISAEHGVGLTKKPFLHFTRSPEEIELMKAIKKVFDPDGIMNPGKVI